MRIQLLLLSLAFAISSLSVGAEPVVIDGVPFIGWSTRRSHDIAAVWAVLAAQGCPWTYEELMVASGAAFRTAWWPSVYSYRARVAAPQDLPILAAQAAGATRAERVSFASPDEAWQAVCGSLDAGRPVVASQDTAAFVVCGYEADGGRRMYVRRYDTTERDYEVRPFQTYPGPTDEPNEFIFVEYDPNNAAEGLDWPTVLAHALQFADWPPAERVHNHLVFGLAAYDAWIWTLRGSSVNPKPENNGDVTYTLSMTLADARDCAAAVLERDAALHPALSEAAAAYRTEATILRAMKDVLAQKATGAWNQVHAAMLKNHLDPSTRELAAQLIEQAKEQEVIAVEALREALKDLGG
jgi:hypothetical protein